MVFDVVGLVSPPDMAVNFMKAREIGLRVPFSFFEIASFIYGFDGNVVRSVKTQMESSN